MIVEALIRELEEMDRDAEVRFASQPSWPFEYSIAEVIEVYPHEMREPEDEPIERDDEALPVVYLAEGEQLAYLPGGVKNMLGW